MDLEGQVIHQTHHKNVNTFLVSLYFFFLGMFLGDRQ